jgi:hypothetical protein
MSNRTLSFIGRVDRHEESLILGAQQEKAFLKRLLGNRDPGLMHKLYGYKPVRDVFVPATRGVSGKNHVMPKN